MFTSVYKRAGIHDPELVAAYKTCRRMIRRSDPEISTVVKVMPPAVRPTMWALCAGVRVVDDLADTGSNGPGERAARVDAWIAATDQELHQGTSRDPVRRALIHAVLTWDLSWPDLLASIAGLRQDAQGRTFATWEQWSEYSQAVNTSLSIQFLHILTRAGLGSIPRAGELEAITRWMEALFLTDMLIDLSDDITNGCVHLPSESLEYFGVTPQDLSERRWTPGMQALLAHLAAKARAGLDDEEWMRELSPAIVLIARTGSGLCRVKLRACEQAGKTLLRRTPRVPLIAWHRVLVPRRIQAAALWALFPPRLPASLNGPSTMADGEPSRPLAPRTNVPPPQPPPPHPSGARPPALPAERMPQHVAIVMDGNGRWATKQGLPRTAGHQAGSEALRDVIHGALEIGLRRLTVYAFSTENWKRSMEEIRSLTDVMCETLADPAVLRHNVRLRWLGSPDGLPRELVDALADVEDKTRSRTGLTLTLCINYGGRAEITEAAGALARAAVAGRVDPAHISEQVFTRYLTHPDLPDVDLLWRTGGDMRTSNFLPWQATYAEHRFTDGYWPGVDRRDLWQAITDYASRERRYGATPAPGNPAKADQAASAAGMARPAPSLPPDPAVDGAADRPHDEVPQAPPTASPSAAAPPA